MSIPRRNALVEGQIKEYVVQKQVARGRKFGSQTRNATNWINCLGLLLVQTKKRKRRGANGFTDIKVKINSFLFIFLRTNTLIPTWPVDVELLKAQRKPPSPALLLAAAAAPPAGKKNVNSCQKKSLFLSHFFLSTMAEDARTEIAASMNASTTAGRDWLLKALDPISIKSEILGMPNAKNHDVVVMNYVSNYTLGPPTYFGSDSLKDSFDADLRLFQHPIVFGVMHAGRQGTRRLDQTTPFTITRFTSSTPVENRKITIKHPIGHEPWTSNIFVNQQLKAAKSSESNRINYLAQNFSKNAEAYRAIYGGAQLIPTCSTMYNQGIIAATQQIFNPTFKDNLSFQSIPKNTPIVSENGDNNTTAAYPAPQFGVSQAFSTSKVQKLTPSDFSTFSNVMTNPRAMSIRFSEGLIVPYRLSNVLENEFETTDNWTISGQTSYNILWFYDSTGNPYTYNRETQTWTSPLLQTLENTVVTAWQICLCCGDDGIPFIIYFYTSRDEESTGITLSNQITFAPTPYLLASGYATNSVQASIFGSSAWPNTASNFGEYYAVTNNNQTMYKHIPSGNASTKEARAFMLSYAGTPNDINTPNLTVNGITLMTGEQGADIGPRVLPYRGQGRESCANIFLRSVSYTATTQLIVRQAYELLVPSGSELTVFKHPCPSYDRHALQSYVRATRKMKDAFSGYYATDKGQPTYMAYLAQMLASVANDDNAIITVGNMGGGHDYTRRSSKR